MKKRTKTLVILVVVLAVALIGALVATRVQEKQEEIAESGETVLSINADDVTAISWNYNTETIGGEEETDEETDEDSELSSDTESTDEDEITGDISLSFTKDGDEWTYDDDTAFPVNSEKIDELLAVFSEFGAAFIIENVEDYDQYGLEDPLGTITLTTADETYEIQLGNFSQLDNQRYVSTGDGNVYLAAVDPMTTYEVTLPDMALNDSAPDYDAISEIDITSADSDESYTIVYDEENDLSPDEDDVYYAKLSDGDAALDTDNVATYLYNLMDLDLTYYATYNATDEELSEYGLDDPELTVTVDYADEDGNEGTYTVSISRLAEQRDADTDEDKTIVVGETEDEDSADETDSEESTDEEEEEEITAYARIGESQLVYEITSDEYESLMEYQYDYMRHAEVFYAGFDTVTKVEVGLDDMVYSFTQGEGEDDETVWSLDGEEVEFDDVESAIEALEAYSFTDEEPSGEEEISFTLYTGSEDEEESDEDASAGDETAEDATSVTIYRYDGDNCLVSIDGTPTMLVPRSEVVDLVEAVNTLVL